MLGLRRMIVIGALAAWIYVAMCSAGATWLFDDSHDMKICKRVWFVLAVLDTVVSVICYRVI